MRALSLRERRFIAIALAVLAVALVWLLAIAPFLNGFAERAAERETLSAAYQRNSRLINAIPAQRRRAEKQGALKDSFFLAAPNANLARDRLRERLRTEFAQTGGVVSAIQDVPSPAGSARLGAGADDPAPTSGHAKHTRQQPTLSHHQIAPRLCRQGTGNGPARHIGHTP